MRTGPRFYLDYFATAEGPPISKLALWVCHLASGKLKRRAATNHSIERGLYDSLGGLGPGKWDAI
jgi:hypothetical protein